jgi:type VI secretion system protein ImpF
MRATTQAERLKPSLLDRLTDDEPAKRRDADHRRFASTKQLRESVVRDLGWLLNSVRLAAVQELDAYPHVAKSVLNFGLPDLAGRTASGVDRVLLERQLRQVIADFEPRLLPSTIVVRVLTGAHDSSHNSLQLRIEAKLVAHPMPLSIWLRTEIDLENGEVSIAEWEREHASSRGKG